MSEYTPYRVEGSYYEACNCEALCPCRPQNGAPGGRSTYGICQFLLSWHVTSGEAGAIDLSGLAVVLAGFYDDDEKGSPWRVMLFVDETADDPQFEALASVFLGRSDGDIYFTRNILDIYDVLRAEITLDHAKGSESIRVNQMASALVVRDVAFDGIISCGIPGHHWPGRESVSALAVSAGPLQWSYEARCGFATGFRYSG